MPDKRCLVLGGAGFIGSHIVEALIDQGYPVRVFDLPRRTLANLARVIDHIEVVEGDFINALDVQRALSDVDFVFHLVSTTLPQTANDNPIYDIESNLIATLRMLNAARVARVAKVVFISSGGTVYGVVNNLPIAETHPTMPISAHGIVKLAIEKYLHLYHHLYNLDYLVLRVSNPYGERQQSIGAQQGVVSVFMDRMRRGMPINIWGDGSTVRDFLYVRDVARAFALAMSNPSPQRIFNVGSGVGTSLNELLIMLEHVTGIVPRINYLPARATDVPCNVLDVTSIRAALNWSATTPLDIGLGRTWEWLRQQEL